MQCDQIEQFLKVLGNTLSHKMGPNELVTFWAVSNNLTIMLKVCGYFLGQFLWRNQATFCSIIWSHWLQLPVVDVVRAPGAEDGLQFRIRHECKFRENLFPSLQERDEELFQRRHLQLERPQRPLQALVVHGGHEVDVLRNVLKESDGCGINS